MNNKLKPLLLFCLLLLFIGTASAAYLPCDANNALVGVITFNETKYAKACYDFSWEHSQDAVDFNNYVISTTGDVVIPDFNFRSKSFTVCTVEPGDNVTMYVRAYDGNAEAHICGFDYNTTIGSGTVLQAAGYFVYMLFAAFAAVIGLIIIVFLGLFVIKKFNIKIR